MPIIPKNNFDVFRFGSSSRTLHCTLKISNCVEFYVSLGRLSNRQQTDELEQLPQTGGPHLIDSMLLLDRNEDDEIYFQEPDLLPYHAVRMSATSLSSPTRTPLK